MTDKQITFITHEEPNFHTGKMRKIVRGGCVEVGVRSEASGDPRRSLFSWGRFGAQRLFADDRPLQP